MYPIKDDTEAASSDCAGPPHPVSEAEYRRVLEPYRLSMRGRPKLSGRSVERRRGIETYAFWYYTLEYSAEGLPGETETLADNMFCNYVD